VPLSPFISGLKPTVFSMAGVHNTRSRLFDKEPGGYQPYQHVQSMGDDFIEDLAYKQNDKHYSLQK
jgi:hypothetical protein